MFSVFLIASLIVALTLGPVSATASEGNGPGVSYNALPGPKDLEISADEDEAFLNGVLKSIFPDGTGGLSDEQKGIAILRYASSALELKNNGGTATKIIREGYAICGGMSHVHRVLCRMVGLPSRYNRRLQSPSDYGQPRHQRGVLRREMASAGPHVRYLLLFENAV